MSSFIKPLLVSSEDAQCHTPPSDYSQISSRMFGGGKPLQKPSVKIEIEEVTPKEGKLDPRKKTKRAHHHHHDKSKNSEASKVKATYEMPLKPCNDSPDNH